MIRPLSALLSLTIALSAISVQADEGAIPERRLVTTFGKDFYGGDIGSIFETDFNTCQSACLNDATCEALTFNTTKGACFLKSGVGREEPFDGALSARIVETSQGARALAKQRAADLEFLPEALIKRAREMAATLGARYAANNETSASLAAAAVRAADAGDMPVAAASYAAAVTLSDSGEHWRQLAGSWAAISTTNKTEERRLRRDALSAAINGYLRAEPNATRTSALVLLSERLEGAGYGREMIPALRLAQSISPDSDVDEALLSAISRHGFRVLEHSVDANAASPRVCVTFSEPLVPSGVSYSDFAIVPGEDLPVEADGSQLCVSGVRHGARYALTLRAGLPARSGETLVRSASLDVYVRDRKPGVRFVGTGTVLPKSGRASIPLVSVNVDEVSLSIHRIGERSLLPTIQDGLFAAPISGRSEQQLAERSGTPVWEGVVETERRLNEDITTAVPVGEAIGTLAPGAYVMTARVPGDNKRWERAATQWFMVTDVGLASISGTDGVHVVARSLGSAEPLADMPLKLLAANNEVLAEVRTDASGIARFGTEVARGVGGRAPAIVVAEGLDGDFAFLDLAKPAFDLSDRGVEGRPAPGPIDVFARTERGIYRPGETVHLTALARDAQANALPGLPLTAIVTRPDGVEHDRAVLADAGSGGRAWSLPLPQVAARGSWAVSLYADPQAPPLRRVNFLVDDFVPEKIDVTLKAADGAVQPTSPLMVELDARYLYGAPGADLGIEGTVRLSTVTGYPAFPGYQFGLHDEELGAAVQSLPTGLTTDEAGEASLDLRLPRIEPVTRPLEVTAVISVSDSSGRPVERSITRPVAPDGARIGIRPLFDGAAEEAAIAAFDVLAVGPDGTQTALGQATWTLSRVETHYQWYEIGGRWKYEPITRRTRVASGQLLLGGDAPARVEAAVEWGRYELDVAADSSGYAAASHAFSAGWYTGGGASDTPDVLEMALDKPSYQIGDTVRVRLKPRTEGKVLLTVVDTDVIEMTALDVEPGETEARLTVTEAWGPGAYITATLIRPADTAAGRNPARALGVGWASVDPGPRKLSMTVTTPEESAPRAPLDAAVRVEGLAPDTSAFVTIAAVDLGILNLTGFETPAPDDWYFGQRRLGVEMRDLYGRLIDPNLGALGRLRTGGDQSPGRLKAPPPTEALVAFFSGVLQVGPDGTARARFDIPDFNGTVRIMAQAWTADGVGHAEKDILVRDPVVVSVAAPRFLAPGDRSRVLIDLAHASGPAGEVTVRAETDGGVSIDTATHTHMLAEGGRHQISLPVTAVEIGDPTIRIFTSTPGGASLSKTLTLPVRANDPEIARRNRIRLVANGGRLFVDQETFSGLAADNARATLTIGAFAKLDAPGLLATLDRYPYGCTEQVTSRAMPLIYFDGLMSTLGITPPDGIDARIADAIATVQANQSAAGAFGLWRPGSGDLWLDAYVSDFLSRAQAQGHVVPETTRRQALDNLRNRLSYAGDFTSGGEGIAYALMVLAREGMASIGDLRYYADARAENFATPTAKAQLGAALASYGEQVRADRLFSMASSDVLQRSDDAAGWRADYGSALRDAAAVLALGLESGSTAIDQRSLLRWISQHDTSRTSTQEKVWMLMAAHALADGTSQNALSINGIPSDGPVIEALRAGEVTDAPMVIENTGPAPVDAVLTVYGVPFTPPAAGSTGYRIERTLYTIDGKPMQTGPITQNSRFVVVLTVHRDAEGGRARLMVEDPLPAGFEIDNPNLLRAGDVAAIDWLDPLENTEMAEFRTDRFLSAVDWEGKGSFQLAYIVRAVSPGTFKHPAARVEDMYRPNERGWTDAGSITVVPGG